MEIIVNVNWSELPFLPCLLKRGTYFNHSSPLYSRLPVAEPLDTQSLSSSNNLSIWAAATGIFDLVIDAALPGPGHNSARPGGDLQPAARDSAPLHHRGTRQR